MYSSMARHRDRRTWYSSGAKSMAHHNTPSRVQERRLPPGQKYDRASAKRGRTAHASLLPAAILVPPLGSPFLRGDQRALPLVSFLWSTRTVSFRERKEIGLDLRRSQSANRRRKILTLGKRQRGKSLPLSACIFPLISPRVLTFFAPSCA